LGDDAFKAQIGEDEVINEDFNHSDWIVLGNVVVEACRQQRALRGHLPSRNELIKHSANSLWSA